MNLSVFKLTRHSIRTSFGRFTALMLIVTLSVGFFSGLKITKSAMAETCDEYLSENNLYDYELLSSIGFTSENVASVKSSVASIASYVEGGKSASVLLDYNEKTSAYKIIAMPKRINTPSIVFGEMPSKNNECVVDARVFDESCIGTTISLSNENDSDTLKSLDNKEYVITGTVNSPLYLGNNRGTADIGSGTIEGFVYVNSSEFTSEYFTELYINLRESATAYSEEYKSIISNNKATVSSALKSVVEERVYSEMGISKSDFESSMSLLALYGIDTNEITAKIAELTDQISTYVLTREENAGYVSFEGDTSIVSGIANILPVFFILIAMLVCVTTMTRMVDEERTQMGVLKAMGYPNTIITQKYLLYSGTATIIGWIVGFFAGTYAIPKIFWYAYSSLYDFAQIKYVFNPYLAIGTLAVALAGILGSAIISCFRELYSNPASLIRPLPSASGKHIILEKIKFIWKKLSFLHKVTLRNMVRYKKRLFMMLVGVSCCAGLVLTSFGVRDSMVNIASLQYENVQTYQMEATFTDEKALDELASCEEINDYITCQVLRVELSGNATMTAVNYYSIDSDTDYSTFWSFMNGKEKISIPSKLYSESSVKPVIISKGIADKMELSVGDTFKIKNSDNKAFEATVSGIFDNYIDNFVIADSGTQPSAFAKFQENTALIHTDKESTQLAEKFISISGVTGVKQLSLTRNSVDMALNSLNYIIWLIVAFAALLEFVVIFNLTNINIAERRREIATVQVLGFYPKEQNSYVLRENLMLSVISSFIGIPLGILFHNSVMKLIVIDRISFNLYINPLSYVVAVLCTILFAVFVDQFMKKQIDKIPMAESLKAVE